MFLHFCRHGESEANLLGAFFNRDSKHPLTERGRAQAEDLARRLALEKLTAIYSSPLTRARQTAEIVGTELGVPVRVKDVLDRLKVTHQKGEAISPGPLLRR